MHLPRLRVVPALTVVFASLFASHAGAADPVTDAMERAYAPYRIALFRTNSNSQAESEQAIAQTRQAWNQLVTQFAQRPAAPYDRDGEFAATLARVSGVYDKAAGEIQKGQLTVAHETLEAARDIMADLRRRNQVVAYSDHMNAYHEEMEHVLTQGPKLLGAADGMLQLAGQVGTLEYLARRLTTEAPAQMSRSEEFVTAAKAVDKSVADLKAAVMRQDANAVREAIGKVKGPYSRMFIKFG